MPPADLLPLIEEALHALPGSLTLDTDLVSLMDSLSLVWLLGELGGRWGLVLSVDDVRACRTPADLLAVTQARA
jgi:acyl carrier protein